MTDHHAGIRFDIYERVQLPDELPEIGQLQQIELLPRISADPGQEQVLLRGHLELQADYIPGSEGEVERTFKHRIPVEISLPARGEISADGIEVEMDRFDVELSSSRSLNVTGVLSISGLSATRASADEANAQLDEALTEEARKSKAMAKPKPKLKPKPKEQSETIKVVADADVDADADAADYDDYPDYAIVEQNQSASWTQTEEQDDEQATVEEHQHHEPVFAAPDKEETKVAFKAKPLNEAEFAGDDQSAQSVKSNNALEWRKLFLGGQNETRFERMRLYIAQREDTIESIADRYELSARDIAMHNQLSEAGVSEGQIVYIPSRS